MMISVVYCTREHNPEHEELLRKSSGLKNDIEIIEIVNNGESLTKAYNRGLKQATNDIVVFCHDDIFFNKNNWGRNLIKHFNNTNYGILGVAGTTDMHESGRWWTDSTKMVGIVKHSHKGKTWESRYSGNFKDSIIETVNVDGLFFAIHKERIKEEFDESVEGFHFYEIDFCFRNKLSGVKIGVMFDIKITHKSVGETNEQWEDNRKVFEEKFKDNLPLNLDIESPYHELDTTLNNHPKLKVIISTNGDKNNLINLHKQLQDYGYPNMTINVIVNMSDAEEYEGLVLDGVEFYEGVYDSLNKNLSILKWDVEFISEEDETILFLSDNVVLKNNIINKFVRYYTKTKKSFGAIFPRTLNKDGTILSCGVTSFIVERGEQRLGQYKMKGNNSYYNFTEGIQMEEMGSVGVCFMTTFKNLEACNWFKLDMDKMFYENLFSLMCTSNKKNIIIDNDCVVQLTDYFIDGDEDRKQLSDDYQKFLSAINEDTLLRKYLKTIKQ